MQRWKKFRALWGSFPLPDKKKVDPRVERTCGGLSVWVNHYYITGFMTTTATTKKSRNTMMLQKGGEFV